MSVQLEDRKRYGKGDHKANVGRFDKFEEMDQIPVSTEEYQTVSEAVNEMRMP